MDARLPNVHAHPLRRLVRPLSDEPSAAVKRADWASRFGQEREWPRQAPDHGRDRISMARPIRLHSLGDTCGDSPLEIFDESSGSSRKLCRTPSSTSASRGTPRSPPAVDPGLRALVTSFSSAWAEGVLGDAQGRWAARSRSGLQKGIRARRVVRVSLEISRSGKHRRHPRPTLGRIFARYHTERIRVLLEWGVPASVRGR